MNEKLAWLAGIWDGEGSITIFSHIEKNGCRKLCPTISLWNTDIKMIAEVIKILDSFGIRLTIYAQYARKEKHSDCYKLLSRNMTKIQKFLEIITPYLISKKPQAELLKRFVDSRLSKMVNGIKPQKWNYTEEEQSFEQQMRILNKTGNKRILRDYTLDPLKGDDIVRTA